MSTNPYRETAKRAVLHVLASLYYRDESQRAFRLRGSHDVLSYDEVESIVQEALNREAPR